MRRQGPGAGGRRRGLTSAVGIGEAGVPRKGLREVRRPAGGPLLEGGTGLRCDDECAVFEKGKGAVYDTRRAYAYGVVISGPKATKSI